MMAHPASSSRGKGTSVGDFVVESEIGKGSFARVFLGWHKESRAIVAIKSVELDKLNKKLKENLYCEIQILKTLRHPHIVALHDCVESPTHINLIMEYCELGDLSLFIKKRDKLATHPVTHEMARKYPSAPNAGLHEVVIRHFLKQLASALQFLRNKNYIHRDVKPQNLLLLPAPHLRQAFARPILTASLDSLTPAAGLLSLPMLKLADFGFARVLPSTSLADTLCGSPLYMAPEILRYERYDAKADLWSVGTVLYEMVCGRPPTRARNHVELLRKIEAAKDVVRFPREADVSSEMKSLIRALLKRHPVERLSFDGFFSHPVVTSPIPGLVEDDLPEITSPASSRPPAQGQDRERSPNHDIVAATAATSPAFTSSSSVRRHSKHGDGELQPINTTTSSPRDKPLPSPNKPGSPVFEGRPSRPRIDSGSNGHDGTAIRPNVAASPSNRPAKQSNDVNSRSPTSLPYDRTSSANTIGRAHPALFHPAITEEERAAQDVQDMRDYVVIEKKQVEINALADDIDINRTLGSRVAALGTTPLHPAGNVLIAANIRPFDSSASPSSTSGALSKAIHDASLRLFGYYKLRDRLGGRQSPPLYNPFPTFTSLTPPAGLNLLDGDGRSSIISAADEDSRVVHVVEELATRSDVVYCFAEVKFKQLFPSTPSTPEQGGFATPTAEQAIAEDEDLTADAVVGLAEEAFVLYFKVLNMLARTMDIANFWWSRKRAGTAEVTGASFGAGTGTGNGAIKDSVNHAHVQRVNSVVQWVRTLFNEVLEKTELVQLKLLEGQKRLPEEHPNHPNNHGNDSAVSTGSGPKPPFLSPGTSAEKLMYDRALEMGRAAAIREVSNQDLAGCEISYLTAVHMLEVVLDGDGNSLQRTLSFGGREMKDDSRDDVYGQLDSDDRQIVRKMIQLISTRLTTIKKKLQDIAEAEKSLHAAFQSQQVATYRRSGDVTPRSVNST